MKVVFDTNIFISGFLTATGTSQHIFSLALKRHTIILSPYILDELLKKLCTKLNFPAVEANDLIRFLKNKTHILDVAPNPKIQFKDKKDIPILSLAQASGAHYLITGDKELLKLKKIGTTLILSAREAFEVL